jgi:hypothetical protein
VKPPVPSHGISRQLLCAGSGAHTLPNQCVLEVIFRGVKRPEHEVDHSPLSSTEVKNARDISPLPHTSSLRGT